MPPPPDVQPIVDKMAEYVAKNGADFEESIRAKGTICCELQFGREMIRDYSSG